jgi:glycerophosphoryl diester phosphodiesterase
VPPELLRRGWTALRIGHRGAAALAPENTLASFAAAIRAGVDGIEFDVVAGPRALEVAHGRGASAAPSLDDALEFLARHEVTVQIDLKGIGREAELVTAVRRHGLGDRTLVSSFHTRSLHALAVLAPELPRAFTYPEDRFGLSRRRPFALAIRGGLSTARALLPWRIATMVARAGASAATLNHQLVTRQAVDACHAGGAAVWAWTVNDPARAAALEALGVDAIITDDPRIFRGRSFE